MPKPEKWADFTRTAVVSKQSKHGGAKMVDYAQFACPYNCGMPVEIPTSIVSNNKSTKCLSHLMRCSGVSDDGLKAEDDPRVKEIRLAASGKRARTDGAADVSETAIAIVPCNACVGREEENGRLIVRNDALHGRVQTLEEQNAAHVSTMQAMRGNMEQMQRELAALRLQGQKQDERIRQQDERVRQLQPLVPWANALSAALGFQTSAPPAPALEDHLARIKTLKCSEEKNGKLGADLSRIRQERKQLKEQYQALVARNAEILQEQEKVGGQYLRYYKVVDPMFDDPDKSISFMRRVMRAAHPDKNPDCRKESEAYQKQQNLLLTDLRHQREAGAQPSGGKQRQPKPAAARPTGR